MPNPPQPLNELGETLTQCEQRFIREFGGGAERIATILAMQFEGRTHEYPRSDHLIAFYRVIARLVRIDI